LKILGWSVSKERGDGGFMMSTGLEIHLARHGETAGSLTGRHTGSTDLPLTPHGEVMARQLARAPDGIPFWLVVTSADRVPWHLPSKKFRRRGIMGNCCFWTEE